MTHRIRFLEEISAVPNPDEGAPEHADAEGAALKRRAVGRAPWSPPSGRATRASSAARSRLTQSWEAPGRSFRTLRCAAHSRGRGGRPGLRVPLSRLRVLEFPSRFHTSRQMKNSLVNRSAPRSAWPRMASGGRARGGIRGALRGLAPRARQRRQRARAPRGSSADGTVVNVLDFHWGGGNFVYNRHGPDVAEDAGGGPSSPVRIA